MRQRITGLKQIIRERKILEQNKEDQQGFNAELVLPGEPMIYSFKYTIANRSRFANQFRDMKWMSILKCWFRAYLSTKTPLVLLIRFYVSPPSYVKVKAADLRSEKVPAVMSFELCDYLLSFMEMLHHVLINSYRQFVKIDMEKYYSAEPRTVFKFMKYEHYKFLYDGHPIDPEGEKLGKVSKQ